jgi:AAA family ATP:ADP antiporter
MVGAGVGGILSGVFLFFFNKWENLQIGLALVLIVWILGVYNILARNIAKYPVAYGIEQRAPRLKASLTFIQSIKVLLSSRYLLLVACVVFGYNMFVVFLESVWKSCAGLYSESLVTSFLDIPGATMSTARLYSKTKMTGIYGLQSIFTGVMSLLWIFFVAGPVSKKSWKFTALFTPLLAMVMSLAFWLFYSYGGSFGAGEFKGTHIFYVVFVGLIILSCIKSSKYVFFDTSKERAYIPLDDESKTNGKAAIDAIGSRLAKGLSAVCISGVLTPIYGSIDKAANVSFLMVFVLIFFWIIAVLALNPEYEKKLKQQNS